MKTHLLLLSFIILTCQFSIAQTAHGHKGKLDSLVTPGSYKETYTYTVNGELSIRITYNWDSNLLKWKPFSKMEYLYDNKGNNTWQYVYSFDTQWVPLYKYEYEHDANGNQTKEIVYQWNISTSNWDFFFGRGAAFNQQNVKLTNYSYSSDAGTKVVYKWIRNDYEYDSFNRLKENLQYINTGGSGVWNIQSKSEVVYKGDSVFTNNFWWDADLKNWSVQKDNKSFSVIKYDDNKMVISDISYSWDFISQSWRGGNYFKYAFDSRGNRILQENFQWDTQSINWKPSFKGITWYDSHDNVISSLRYTWNETKKELELYDKSDLVYDTTELGADYFYPYDYRSYFKRLESKYAVFSNNNWTAQPSSVYYYSSNIITGLAKGKVARPFSVYPNPAKDLVFLDGQENDASVLVTDASGESFQMPIRSGTVDISFLKPGMHTIYLENSGNKALKFIKQ